ncbi:MAG: hypothetical protein EAZ91_02370 [Cytophagales bacterium]|nr:MAG: hypothetical protein EAZ91_02370 [Cytophagales bacterium]
MIESIKIVNFKSIREAEITLRPINVLIGSNGAGKSNFVNFFGFLKAISDRELTKFTGDRGGADRILYLGSRVSTELLGIINFENTNRYRFHLAPNDQQNFYFVGEATDYNKAAKKNEDTNWYDKQLGSGHIESRLQNHGSLVIDYVRKYMGLFQVYHFHDTSRTAPLKKTARLQDNVYLRADGSNLPAFLYHLQQTELQSFNWIEGIIRTIAPYFERFDLQPTGDYIRLNWRQKGTDMYLDASDFSDGTIRFVALCTLLAQPNPPRTIIIDEPELGLHPYAITVLAELIKNVKSQVILSTQSVNFVNEFEPEDVIIVENNRNQSTFRHLDKENLTDWLEEYTLSDLWYKNVIGGNP